ncbi:hypothetical protein P691DRAFT_797432 [Macrolepiota fuliginosa MF-IS2]|uniref:MICOS complex subunit n=1 Tax=Macrolepiota fuliginosa MF-IS2 TaxID=1400762 RepID=A0A9P6C3R3_9AGAR|nr:hypothetical protein P691DRAFT_797432 [Macrolepiota fuliginosa MF-IS2]
MYRAASRFLSIYPSSTPDIVLVETPSSLENHIGVARRQMCQTYRDGREYVQGWVSKWIGIEHAVENRVKSIISPQESLTPGLLYVGVATLTGSILARNRLLVTRLILPPVFLVASAKHFLPKTTRNLTDYVGSIEDTYFPNFSEKHEIAKTHTAMTWERIREATKGTRAHVNHGAIAVVEKVQEATGLKLRETLGWAEEAKQHAEERVVEVKEVVEEAIEEVKTTVDQKIEEIKEEVVKEGEKVEEEKEVEEEKVEQKKVEEVKRLI